MQPTSSNTAPPSPTTTSTTTRRFRVPHGSASNANNYADSTHPPSFSLPPFLPPQRTPVQIIGARRASGSVRPAPTVRLPPRPRPAVAPVNITATPRYRAAEKNIRVAIVALPVAIVTSYVLYQRVIVGEERKVLGRDTPDVRTI
ncbi:hypothetical protein EDC01DRAFT_775220 [Geopyxis carbonaria]|nr:hypothetical protein EDC01DRAFT_775220 [Geopyxis carbonaria]